MAAEDTKTRKRKSATEPQPKPKKMKKSDDKKSKAPKKPKEPSPEAESEVQDYDSEVENAEEDDQTAALLAGFESEGDESDIAKEDEAFDIENPEVEIPGHLTKSLTKASKNTNHPGVVFVGRIPHGFYEPQMKSYFSQFGHVKRLRVSRNKKTGASKHYAFVEFASSDVADIVAKTMDKYLMFNHILQCKVIPPEQVHADMFKGAGHRFKAIPLNKMAGAQMARGAERAIWEKRVEKENKRRQKKAKQSEAAFGYEYEAPTLKATEGVPKKALALRNGSEQPLQIEASGHDTVAGAIEPKGAEKLEHAVPEPAQSALDKKSKKGKKAKTDVAPEKGEDTVDAVEPALEKKTKKGKKSKANAVLDNVEDVLEAAADVLIESAELASDKKTKRGKKTKANTVPGNVEEGVEAPADGVLEPAEPILNTKTKKGKKAKASVLPENVEEAVAAVVDGVSELAEAVLDKKTKKGKKSKANAASEHLEEAVEPATKDAPKKQESKDAKVSSVVETSTPEKKRKAAPAEEGAAIPKKAKKVKKVKA